MAKHCLAFACLGTSHDFDAQVARAFIDFGPQPGRLRAGVEDRVEQLSSDLRHSLLNARGDGRSGIIRELKIIFQIPSQVLLVVLRHFERKRNRSASRWQAVAAERESDEMPARAFGRLCDPQRCHARLPDVRRGLGH